MMAEVKITTRESEQVYEAFYDDEIQQMRVVFKKNGAQYQYYDVDQATADAMADTPWNTMKQQLQNYTRIA
jgi:hypothetical protein